MRRPVFLMTASALGLIASVALNVANAQDKTIKIGALLAYVGPRLVFRRAGQAGR